LCFLFNAFEKFTALKERWSDPIIVVIVIGELRNKLSSCVNMANGKQQRAALRSVTMWLLHYLYFAAVFFTVPSFRYFSFCTNVHVNLLNIIRIQVHEYVFVLLQLYI